jgi:hypothetical protein
MPKIFMKKLNWDNHSVVKELIKRFLTTLEVKSSRQIKSKFKNSRDSKLLNYAQNANTKQFGYSDAEILENNKCINAAKSEITPKTSKIEEIIKRDSSTPPSVTKSPDNAKNSLKHDVLINVLEKKETRGRKKLPVDKKMVVGQFTIEPAYLEKLRQQGSVSVIVRALVLKYLDELI